MARKAKNVATATPAPVATPAPANLAAMYQAATAAPATPTRQGGGSGWPLAATLAVAHQNHGCKPGSRRAAIMQAVLACLAGGGTVAQALAVARPMQGGPEDLRILASKGCIAAPAGASTATRAQAAKLASAGVAATA